MKYDYTTLGQDLSVPATLEMLTGCGSNSQSAIGFYV